VNYPITDRFYFLYLELDGFKVDERVRATGPPTASIVDIAQGLVEDLPLKVGCVFVL
jgi:hypothetical protein